MTFAVGIQGRSQAWVQAWVQGQVQVGPGGGSRRQVQEVGPGVDWGGSRGPGSGSWGATTGWSKGGSRGGSLGGSKAGSWVGSNLGWVLGRVSLVRPWLHPGNDSYANFHTDFFSSVLRPESSPCEGTESTKSTQRSSLAVASVCAALRIDFGEA